MSPAPIAADGLRARENGGWAREKLAFLDDFGPVALKATERISQRVYVDLFAGPGRNVDRISRTEFEGSPIRALRMRNGGLTFTHAVLVNYHPKDHAALIERAERLYRAGEGQVPWANIRVINADANAVVEGIMAGIPTWAYVFVFADIEGTKHWPWSSVETLKRGGHRRVDLYALFPLEMAIMRLLAYEAKHRHRFNEQLTAYFGTDEWKRLAGRRITSSQSSELRNALTELYRQRLQQHWRHTGQVLDVPRRGDQNLYRMLFASNNDAGKRIAAWAAKRRERAQQLGLL